MATLTPRWALALLLVMALVVLRAAMLVRVVLRHKTWPHECVVDLPSLMVRPPTSQPLFNGNAGLLVLPTLLEGEVYLIHLQSILPYSARTLLCTEPLQSRPRSHIDTTVAPPSWEVA